MHRASLATEPEPPSCISIITVVRNHQADIACTIESVAGQRDASFEYIVVDGASTDGTLAVLRDYRFQIDRLVSGVDRGIYDAMMKGVHIADGDWVIFLGAGDRFVHDRVLAQFDPDLDADMAYGSCYFGLPGRLKYLPVKPLEHLWKGNCFSHQSFFCRRKLLIKLGFSEHLSIVADYDLYVRALARGHKITNLDRPIAIVQAGGISDAQFYRRTIERFTVVRKAFPGTADTPLLQPPRVAAARQRRPPTSAPRHANNKPKGRPGMSLEIIISGVGRSGTTDLRDRGEALAGEWPRSDVPLRAISVAECRVRTACIR